MSEQRSEPARLRALVVEDDPTSRRVLELILESRGASTAVATNGAEAVEVFQREPFDLVFMDLQMPVMDGYQATREIRSFEASRQAGRTPIIVVSAFTRAGDIAQAAEAGADQHLGKPVNVPQLLGAIEHRNPGRRTPIVVVSAFDRAGDIARATEAGADQHLGKPVNVPQLLGAIETLTSAS